MYVDEPPPEQRIADGIQYNGSGRNLKRRLRGRISGSLTGSARMTYARGLRMRGQPGRDAESAAAYSCVAPTLPPNPAVNRMSHNSEIKGTFSFVSLGCPKNLVDSERMLGLLAQDGYALVPDAKKADLVIINTCGFIDAARQESLGVIREMLDRKTAGAIKGVVVAGCLAERQKEMLLDEVPEVDQVVGVFGREEIARVADRIMGDLHEQRTVFRPAPVQAQDDRARLRITPRHLAYLKVSEGCDRLCTFCAIPYMRGKHVTKPIEKVVEEARELAADGVRELNLVAQDMTYYGIDLYGRPRLAELLRELDQVEGIDWIRVLYNYPNYFTDELYEALAGVEKVMPYLDMPLQHINDRDAQGDEPPAHPGRDRGDHRPAAGDDPEPRAADDVHRRLPRRDGGRVRGIARLRRGGPKFERLGVFPYSFEPDTPAAKLPGPPRRRGEDRAARPDHGRPAADRLRVQRGARRPGAGRPDRRPEGGARHVWLGRTFADAPDVDGVCLRRGSRARTRRPRPLHDRRRRGVRPRSPGPRSGPPSRRKARPKGAGRSRARRSTFSDVILPFDVFFATRITR